jgi:hypothetical protein
MALWGKTDAEESRPNWINLDLYPEGTQLVFVDETEAQIEENKARGIKGTGWYLLYEYTGSGNTPRKKAELVVAMRVSAEDAGDNDDLVNFVLVISEQPQDVEVVEGEPANFSVDYSFTIGTAEVDIQWQRFDDVAEEWEDIEGETDFDLAVTETNFGNNGTQFRAVLSVDGDEVAVSDVATLTITQSEEE